MKKELLLIVISLLVFTGMSKAQDIHFSQFYASPLSVNPANTGNYTGDWRLMNSFRRQWSTIKPYTTNAIAYDRQFYIYNENISGGVIFISDKSGLGDLVVNKFLLSAAYHKGLWGHNFHVGIQAGYVQKNINMKALTFPDQYDRESGAFNSALPNGETSTIGDQLSYLDMNIGLVWNKRYGKIDYEGGLAFFHFNYPKERFFSASGERLITRKVLHGSAKWDLTEKIFIQPRIFLMGTNKATDYLVGSNAGYRVKPNKLQVQAIFGGILFRDGLSRNLDAFIAIAGVNFKNLDVGLSYDYNISDLKVASNYMGGFEISVIYTGISTVPKKVTIPCDRY